MFQRWAVCRQKLNLIFVGRLFTLTHNIGYAQNLVPNPGFEEYEECPSTLNQLSVCSGWWNARGTCDYYNACSTSYLVGVPYNVWGYREALSGNAYGGFASIAMYPDYREHLMTQLIEPLNVGQEYYFSFYISRMADQEYNTRGSNKQGIRFTNTFL